MAPVSLETYNGVNPSSASSQNNRAQPVHGQDNAAAEGTKSNVILFNSTKNELYKLDDGYKTLMRRQRGYWKIMTNTHSITSDAFTTARVFVLAGSREKFTENEINHLKRYLETGGSLLVLLGEGQRLIRHR
jgi:hypothetical protein